MINISPQTISLEEFLQRPETKPSWEYIDGKIFQKPMPKSRHSRLQSKLIDAINARTENDKIAYAFPELRCSFGGRSIVPAIAVLKWENIQLDEAGEPIDDVLMAPDWTIELLSPEQSSNRVTGNILHCFKFGCQLGWLIDPDDTAHATLRDRSILIFQPEKQPELRQGSDKLTVLPEIDLDLSVEAVFNWLKMN